MSFWNKLSSFALPALGGVGGFLAGGPVGALIGAGVGSSISSGFNSVDAQEEANKYNMKAVGDTNATNMAIARENNEAAYKMWQEQRSDNRRYYDDTMAYNSSAAQVERLRQAGLNPALAMYQGVNAGSVSASSSPAPPVLQQPVLQAPHIAPVDYSPISSGILNSASLLKDIAPAVESLFGAKDAAKRAGAQTKAAESGAKAAETTAEILNQQLKSAEYEATVAQFKHTALATLGVEKGQKLTTLFNDAFVAELESKVAGKHLTDAQISNIVKDTSLKTLEEQKQTLSKSGYSEMLNLINSIDNSFFKSLAKIVATIAMIGK